MGQSVRRPPMPSVVREHPESERVWAAFCRWAGPVHSGEQLRWFLRGWDAGREYGIERAA